MCEICHGHQNCPVCRKDEELGDCPTCGGTGTITGWDYEIDETTPLPFYTTCPDCDGSGEIQTT